VYYCNKEKGNIFMQFKRYTDVNSFQNDVLDILLENEVVNNLPVGILTDSNKDTSDNWLMATITDDTGKILLIALCTPPFNLLLCKPEENLDDGSVGFLADELKRIRFSPSGIIAPVRLAECFADAYCGSIISKKKHMTMIIMQLDKLAEYTKAPGYCRMLCEDDLSFTPGWECAFCVECKIPVYTLEESEKRIRTRIGKNTHYIWVDEKPVAQAAWGRTTPNSAAISWVYTPPGHRGKGYATSVVAELSKAIFESGKSSCCLFADAANPASQGVYKKLGYYEVSRVSEIKFDIE